MLVWQVKRGVEGRIRQGYPWVFSNELAQSPRAAQPGEAVELHDHTDAFVARGYGHPHSLISFRALTRDPEERDFLQADSFFHKLRRAAGLRAALGLSGFSHRLCFAEADGVPGLIVDRYLPVDPPDSQVLVVESSTAGLDRALPEVMNALEGWAEWQAQEQPGGIPWLRTGVILDQGAAIRTLEELPSGPKTWWKTLPGLADGPVPLKLAPVGDIPAPVLWADLIGGQKTGFFLDHQANLELAARLMLSHPMARRSGAPVRILDLFCYGSQWGARLAHLLTARGIPVEVTAVDASGKALELAERHLTAVGARVRTQKLDIVEQPGQLDSTPFDIVVCDPPALIKRKKDVLKGARAYQKVNREALRRVAPGGIIVACSCSGLLVEDHFREVLHQAGAQAGRTVQWVARGGQGPDHPVLAGFPEGRYLKCWIGVVDNGHGNAP
jgi:23S rRNA (cytosine1962-C5)-methyltransferase